MCDFTPHSIVAAHLASFKEFNTKSLYALAWHACKRVYSVKKTKRLERKTFNLNFRILSGFSSRKNPFYFVAIPYEKNDCFKKYVC